MTSDAAQGDQPGTGHAEGRPLAGRVRPGAPRVAALDALLREIDDLRTSLQTDLSLAAGALDADAPDLAAHLLATDREELAAFERRSLEHLRALEAADAVPAARPEPAPAAVPLAARRRRRLSALLPAAPLVAAAAALVGLLVVPDASDRSVPADTAGEVMSSWQELSRLSAADAPAAEVQAAALTLNAEIASMVEAAGGDPAAARKALELLRVAQQVLAADDDADALQGVLRQSRALAARLLAGLPSLAPTRLPPPGVPVVAPDAAPPPSARPARAPRAGQQRPAPRQQEQQRATASPKRSQAARPAPSRAPESPAASPSTSPTQAVPTVLPGPLTEPL